MRPKQPQQPVVPLASMKIEFDPVTGQCRVTGPINNPCLAYGMLEKARDEIFKHNEKKANSCILTMDG